MDLPPTSSLRFLDVDGGPLAAPPEWAPALVEVKASHDLWDDIRLERNDGPLTLSLRTVGGRGRIVADWPRSGAGHYELRLAVPGHPTQLVAVTVLPRKISASGYAALLADLDARLPISIAVGLQRLGALTGVEVVPAAEDTLAQQLTRLRHAVAGREERPGLAKILAAVAADPHRVLSGTDTWVPRERARRVSPTSLTRLVASSRNLEADGLPRQLPESRVEDSFDVYENRLLGTFHEQLDQRLRRLDTVLAASGRIRQRAEVDDLLRDLTAARRRARFLDDVGPLPHLPDRLTMVLRKRPEYRNALEGFIEFHRSVVARLEEPALDAPLEGLPTLYEAWGVLQVLDVLLEVAGEHGYEPLRQSVVTRDASGLFVRVLANGRPALVLRRSLDGTTVRAIPQRSYTRAGAPYRSLSFQQRPDLTLEVEGPEGAELHLFDPKYKLASEEALPTGDGKPKKLDVDTMHAYRDSIRDSAGRRVVRRAAILYPGPNHEFDRGVAALGAIPGEAGPLRASLRERLSDALAGPSASALD